MGRSIEPPRHFRLGIVLGTALLPNTVGLKDSIAILDACDIQSEQLYLLLSFSRKEAGTNRLLCFRRSPFTANLIYLFNVGFFKDR